MRKTYSATLSHDGKHLAITGTVGDGEASPIIAIVYDTRSGKKTRQFAAEGPDAWLDAIAFSGDGKLLAVADRLTDIHIWELASGKKKQQLSPPSQKIGSTAIAFSPTTDRLVVGRWGEVYGQKNTWLQVWNIADGKLLADFRDPPVGPEHETREPWIFPFVAF